MDVGSIPTTSTDKVYSGRHTKAELETLTMLLGSTATTIIWGCLELIEDVDMNQSKDI